jgi:hypothetical protein
MVERPDLPGWHGDMLMETWQRFPQACVVEVTGNNRCGVGMEVLLSRYNIRKLRHGGMGVSVGWYIGGRENDGREIPRHVERPAVNGEAF